MIDKQVLENLLEPSETVEFSRLMGVGLIFTFVAINAAAWYRGNWSILIFNASAIQAMFGAILLVPEIELWQIGRDEREYRYE